MRRWKKEAEEECRNRSCCFCGIRRSEPAKRTSDALERSEKVEFCTIYTKEHLTFSCRPCMGKVRLSERDLPWTCSECGTGPSVHAWAYAQLTYSVVLFNLNETIYRACCSAACRANVESFYANAGGADAKSFTLRAPACPS